MFVIGGFQVLKYFKYWPKIYNSGPHPKSIRTNMTSQSTDIDLGHKQERRECHLYKEKFYINEKKAK